MDGGEDGLCFRGGVDDVCGALAALLAHSDVDDRKGKAGGFHDAAG